MILLLLVTLPALTGALLALAGSRGDRPAAGVSVAVSAVTAGLAVACVVGRPSVSVPFVAGGDLGLAVDALAALVLPAVAMVTLAVLLFSAAEQHEARARFFGLMLLFEAAALLMVTATTLVTVLVAFEVMGATSYALIGLSWRDPVKTAAAQVAFVTTRATDLGLYVAAGAALAGTGTMALVDLPTADGRWLDVATAGLVVAALGKAAQLPFSFWLSRAMEGPSPVSALLHSAAMVAMGGYLLLRVQPLLAASGWGEPVVAWAGALTAMLLGLVAVAQSDLKQLLAASTAAQLGFVVLAAGTAGVAAGGMHLVAHAAVKSLLFLVAGLWLAHLGTRELGRLGGAVRATPVAGACFVVGALALAGLPPLSLWVTKDTVLAGALEISPALYAAGLLGSALSAVYAGKALFLVLAPAPPQRQTTGWLVRTPLVGLAAAAATFGALGLPAVAGPLREMLGAAPAPHAWELAGSAALVVAGLLLARRRPAAPLPAWEVTRDWFRLELVAYASVVRPTTRLATALAQFDDRMLHPAVVGLARTARAAGGRLARFDDGALAPAVDRTAIGTMALARSSQRLDDVGVDGAVRAFAARTRQLGELARRPQTGQLHTYYAQAAAFLVAAFLLLLMVR